MERIEPKPNTTEAAEVTTLERRCEAAEKLLSIFGGLPDEIKTWIRFFDLLTIVCEEHIPLGDDFREHLMTAMEGPETFGPSVGTQDAAWLRGFAEAAATSIA